VIALPRPVGITDSRLHRPNRIYTFVTASLPTPCSTSSEPLVAATVRILGGTLLDLSSVIVVSTAALATLFWLLSAQPPQARIAALSDNISEAEANPTAVNPAAIPGASSLLPMGDCGQLLKITPAPGRPDEHGVVELEDARPKRPQQLSQKF
jgi:hypothetical protein